MSVEAGVSGFVAEAKFKASASYKSKSNAMSNSKRVFVSSTARCYTYKASLRGTLKPKLSEEFLASVESLQGAQNEDFFALFDEFGTHYVAEMKMGAKFGYFSTLSEEGFSKLASEGFDVGVAASASYGAVSGGAAANVGREKEAASKFTEAKDNTQSYSIGSKPSGTGLDWA